MDITIRSMLWSVTSQIFIPDRYITLWCIPFLDASLFFPPSYLKNPSDTMPKGRKASNGKQPKPSVVIPKPKDGLVRSGSRSAGSGSPATTSASPVTPVTPKTPADEGIEFFQSQVTPGETPIRVYELRLDADGGPHKDRSVCPILPAL